MADVLAQAEQVVRQADARYNQQLVKSKLDEAELAVSRMSRGKPYSVLSQKLKVLQSHFRPDMNDAAVDILVTRADKLVSDAAFFQADTNRRVGQSVRRSVEMLINRTYGLPANIAADFQEHIFLLKEVLEEACDFEDYLAIFKSVEQLEAELSQHQKAAQQPVVDLAA